MRILITTYETNKQKPGGIWGVAMDYAASLVKRFSFLSIYGGVTLFSIFFWLLSKWISLHQVLTVSCKDSRTARQLVLIFSFSARKKRRTSVGLMLFKFR